MTLTTPAGSASRPGRFNPEAEPRLRPPTMPLLATDWLTDEEVRTIRANLTMLEVVQARRATSDRTEVALRAYWLAAMKVLDLPAEERAEPKDTKAFEHFLGRLRSEQFQRIAEEVSPLGSGGEPEPGSSGSMDSLPESS